MKPDSTIDAVRKARHEISALVGHDPRKLVAHYQRLQEQYRARIVSRHGECGEKEALTAKPSPEEKKRK